MAWDGMMACVSCPLRHTEAVTVSCLFRRAITVHAITVLFVRVCMPSLRCPLWFHLGHVYTLMCAPLRVCTCACSFVELDSDEEGGQEMVDAALAMLRVRECVHACACVFGEMGVAEEQT